MNKKTLTAEKLDFKPYSHFYLGCEMITPEGIDFLSGVYEKSSPVLYSTVKDYPDNILIPILRKLDSITPEEATQLGRIFFQLERGEFDLGVFEKDQFFKLTEKNGDERMIVVDWSKNRVCVDELNRFGEPVFSDNALTDAIAYLIKKKFWMWSTQYFDEGVIADLNGEILKQTPKFYVGKETQ